MNASPTGTITFLFTDIEGSTKLWESSTRAVRPALARHDRLLRQTITDNGGYVFKTIGDAFCAAFPTAPQALGAALAAQLALTAEPWETQTPLRVRMALHTGTVEEREGDYYGPPLNRVARLMDAGHGGQILLSLAAQELARDAMPAAASFLDLGPRRLKDLTRPETVFQLLHPALPAEFPPLRSLDNSDLPNNLPQQTTSFIGREAQLTEVRTLLARVRLLTLTGAGGSGKTRLSLQVAADLLDSEEDGVWLVELASLSDPALVPKAIAGVLGVKEAAGKSISQALVEWLKHRHLLLILDNCEHLVAACASIVADILRNCPQVRLLTSSREPLAVAGEQTYRVPSLSLPDPEKAQTAESLSQYEAVRLFIERAQAVQPLFSVTDASVPAVAQVCFHLDGIPLAIELAAVRVRSLSVEEINRHLDQRFRLLTSGSRDLLPRQQTLRALIDWSYDLLTDKEKSLLRRLSVFAGGWTIPSAEAACAGEPVETWEVLNLLMALVDKSLVVADSAADGTRYRLLETVRQYSGDRLRESGETEAVCEQVAVFFLALAEEAEPQFYGPEQAAWLSRLETEHDNLRASLSWHLSGESCHKEDTSEDGGLRLAAALWRFWSVRGHLSEGRRWLDLALARAGEGEASAARSKALLGAGVLAANQGDFAGAHVLQKKSLTLYRQMGDTHGIAAALGNLGAITHSQGGYAGARALHEESLKLYRQIADKRGIAIALESLGAVAHGRGDILRAWALFEESLTFYRQLRDQRGIAHVLRNLGIVALNQGDRRAASALFEESLTLSRQLGNQSGIANALSGLGEVAHEQGDDTKAGAFYEESLALYRQLGEQRGIAVVLTNLGNVARCNNDNTRARAFYAESLALKQRLGVPWSVAFTLEEWAALAAADGDAVRAVRMAGAAQAMRDATCVSLRTEQKDTHEQTQSACRASLGEVAFAAAWDTGRAMTLDEAVEYALGTQIKESIS